VVEFLVGFRLGSDLGFSFSSGVVVGHDDDDDYAYTHRVIHVGVGGAWFNFWIWFSAFKKKETRILISKLKVKL